MSGPSVTNIPSIGPGSAVSAPQSSPILSYPTKPSEFPGGQTAAGTASASGHHADHAGATPPASQPLGSPRQQLDPALGLVVLEFFDSKGKLVSSIPTQAQLESYRKTGVPKNAKV